MVVSLRVNFSLVARVTHPPKWREIWHVPNMTLICEGKSLLTCPEMFMCFWVCTLDIYQQKSNVNLLTLSAALLYTIYKELLFIENFGQQHWNNCCQYHVRLIKRANHLSYGKRPLLCHLGVVLTDNYMYRSDLERAAWVPFAAFWRKDRTGLVKMFEMRGEQEINLPHITQLLQRCHKISRI